MGSGHAMLLSFIIWKFTKFNNLTCAQDHFSFLFVLSKIEKKMPVSSEDSAYDVNNINYISREIGKSNQRIYLFNLRAEIW